MSDETVHPQEAGGDPLSPAASELLRALLLDPAPDSDPALSTKEIVRYYAGLLTEDQRASVLGRACQSRAGRHALVEVRRCLDLLEPMTMAEVEAHQASENATMAHVARVLKELTFEQMQAAPANPWRAGWQALWRQFEEGVLEAQAAVTRFAAFADQWKMALRAPGPAAVTRGGDEAEVRLPTDWPAGLHLTITEARVSESASFHATGEIRDSEGQLSHRLDGATLFLGLSFGGDVWPVSSSSPRDGVVSWTEHGFGRMLDIPPMRIPSALLGVGLDGPPAAEGGRTLILASVAASGAAKQNRVAPLWIVEAPRQEAGELRLSVELPPLTRAVYAAAELEIRVAISPAVSQLLGSWAVRDWPDTGTGDSAQAGQGSVRALIAPCPASIPGGSFPASALRACLRLP